MKVLINERENVYKKFQELKKEIDNTKVLNKKIRELIKLSACVTEGSIYGVSLHVRDALEAGAVKDEIIDTIICCLPVCGISFANQALESASATIKLVELEGKN